MSGAAVATVALVVGVLGWVGGYLLVGRGKAQQAEREADQKLASAKQEAEAITKDAELEAKQILLKAKGEAEKQSQKRSDELNKQKNDIKQQQQKLAGKEKEFRKQETQLAKKEKDLTRREEAAESMARRADTALSDAKEKLADLAKMTPEQALDLLKEQLRDEAKRAAASEIKAIEEETQRELRDRSTTIIATAIQRYASEYVAERTVSVVPLPNDEMKGRIIGREGRNIRALEAATGVDLIIDDTPEAVILSCFNPLRREIGRMTLERLLADGRIHPSRIEEVVGRCEKEIKQQCKESGEQAVFDLGLNRMHPELILLLGELRFRSSYAQNLLQHSVEVGYLAGAIASELGTNQQMARRAGLLHDIGKAIPHEVEGSHAAVGANTAKKYGESPKVVHAIAAHHGEVEPKSLLAVIVDAANRLSSQRPGARREKLASYIQRLNDLEALCQGYDGVERAFALQAGREVRVIVAHKRINDEMAVMLSRDIAKQIEDQLAYPGQITVNVIRESRASDTAR